MVHQKAVILSLVFFVFTFTCKAQEIVSSQTIFPKLQSIVKNHSSDYLEHSVKRMGNNTLTMEAFFAVEADWNLAKSISQEVSNYPKWVTPRINDRGGGEKFFIQFSNISASSKHSNSLDIDVFLDLPALKIPIKRIFKFEPINNPDKNVFSIRVSALAAEDSPVKDLSGYSHVFKNPNNPNQLWGYLTVTVVLTHWIVYESLPERLLNREIGERIRILMENYQNYENTKRGSQPGIQIESNPQRNNGTTN